MKKFALLLAVMIFILLPGISLADQPYQYALVKCSGLPFSVVVQAEQAFDTAYGWEHNLTTEGQWQATFESRANEFASALGCPKVLQEGQLTFWYKIYVPTYQRILR